MKTRGAVIPFVSKVTPQSHLGITSFGVTKLRVGTQMANQHETVPDYQTKTEIRADFSIQKLASRMQQLHPKYAVKFIYEVHSGVIEENSVP